MRASRGAAGVEPFEFEHGGRRFTCHTGARAGGTKEVWWWFEVSGDAQRYAAFQAGAEDTQQSVEQRIIAFHDAMLERRASVPAGNQPWWQRRKQEPSKP
jgi:hypothetical protein